MKIPFKLLWLALPVALLHLGACDDIARVRNVAPDVSVEGLCTEGGRTFVMVRVFDFERASVDIELVAEVDGRRQRLGTGSGGDGLEGLSSARYDGVLHKVEWGAPCDAACEGEPEVPCPEACVDPCDAPPEELLSGVSGCAALPDPPPATLKVVPHASDGEDAAVGAEVEVELVEGCPVDG